MRKLRSLDCRGRDDYQAMIITGLAPPYWFESHCYRCQFLGYPDGRTFLTLPEDPGSGEKREPVQLSIPNLY